LILALLVGKSVIAQASFGSSNTSNNTNKINSRTQSQNKFAAFNIKQQRVVFLKLSCKEGKKNIVYVNGGRVMAAVSI
jgi:hypothetical protein